MFSNSTFGTILKLLPREIVRARVEEHASDRWCKRFKSWDHLVVMLAAQLSGVSSLRDVETMFNGAGGLGGGHHYHLGAGEVRRATLSDANKNRDYRLFRDLALDLIATTGRGGRPLRELITLLDSSPIKLSGRGHDWARSSRTRAHSEALKLHLGLILGSGEIDYVAATPGNVNDITQAREMTLEAGRIYVFDKGYCDYNWWREIADAGSRFVTRLKRNAAYEVIEERPVARAEAGFILADQVIRLSNKAPRGGKLNSLAGRPLRLVRIQHPGGKKRPFVIVSNALEASAAEIAGWYKARWSIELLFKWLKQNLGIKRFMGESRNAIMIQLFVAIIAYTLLKLYHKLHSQRAAMRLKDLAQWVRGNLFVRPETERRRHRKRVLERQNQAEFWALT